MNITQTTTKYQTYPKYKPSGIDWLGDIPEEWEIKKMKYSSKINMGQSPSSDDCNTDGVGVPFLQGNGEFGDIHPVAKQFCENPNKIAKEQDILLSVRAPVGELNIADQRYGIGRGLCSITPNATTLDRTYLWFSLSVLNEELSSLSTGSTYDAVSIDEVKDLRVIMPNFKIQKNITTFLNKKIAQIDEVVAKKQKLIELLLEKRQAIISQAVTKGLSSFAKASADKNPKVKMKDSGVDWLDEIPENWEVKKIKHVAKIVLGKMLQNEDQGNDKLKPYLRAQNILWEKVDTTDVKEMWLSDYEQKRYRVRTGDLLVSEGGEVGRTAIWNNEISECYIQNSVHEITVNNRMNNHYLLYLLETYGKNGYIDSIVNRVSIGHLTREKLKEVEILIPSKKEQSEIAGFINMQIIKIDGLVRKVKLQNKKLQEFRQALISNVVTGKVKVIS